MSVVSYLRAAPKVELHVHLEGAIQPPTLLELARRNHIPLPADTIDGVRRWFTYRDFPHFAEIYLTITRCLKTVDDYELIVHECGAAMARQNVRYAEVTFSPGTHRGLGIPHDVSFGGLTRGRERARVDFGVEIAWVFDIVRQVPLDADGRALAAYVTDAAIAGRADGVVALGLGGAEASHPPEPFAPWFERARAAGLHSAPHAGETAGPASVWGALRALEAERIGHGVRASEDPALVEYLAERGIPLEVCPTSNVRIGVYPDLAAHPLSRLHAAGVIVTINSDDPPLFNTTLNDEVVLLDDPFGLGVPAIDEILLNGVRHSFLAPERKREMAAAFTAEWATLKVAHLDGDAAL